MTSHMMQDDTVWPQTVPGSLPGAWHGPRLFVATRVFCRQIVYNCSQFVDKKAFTGFSHYSPPGSPRLWPEPGPSVAKAQNQSAPPLAGPDCGWSRLLHVRCGLLVTALGIKGVFYPNPAFFQDLAQLIPYELTHVRASPRDCADGLAQAARKI